MSTRLETSPDAPEAVAFQVSPWHRFVAAVKAFMMGTSLVWIAVAILLQLGMFPNMRNRMRVRLATAIALPAGALVASRRYLAALHTLRLHDDQIEVRSFLRKAIVEPLEVDGVVAVDGLNFSGGDVLVWKQLALLANGRKYTLQFDPAMNEVVYELLREHCIHAWGVPFSGELETPKAGPELSASEYADALAYVQRHYLRQMQKASLTGPLMVLGSIAVLMVLVMNLAARPRLARAMLWPALFAFAGVLVVLRSFRQLSVFYKIRDVQRRFREAI